MQGAAPLCDIPLPCCFFTGPWTVVRSTLCMLRWVAAFCWPLRPVFLTVWCRFCIRGAQYLAHWGCTGCCGGRFSVFAVHSPPHPVSHHLPRHVSVGMWSVGLLFLHGALGSHLFFLSRAASGHCVLTAAAACVPCGVISAFPRMPCPLPD